MSFGRQTDDDNHLSSKSQQHDVVCLRVCPVPQGASALRAVNCITIRHMIFCKLSGQSLKSLTNGGIKAGKNLGSLHFLGFRF